MFRSSFFIMYSLWFAAFYTQPTLTHRNSPEQHELLILNHKWRAWCSFHIRKQYMLRMWSMFDGNQLFQVLNTFQASRGSWRTRRNIQPTRLYSICWMRDKPCVFCVCVPTSIYEYICTTLCVSWCDKSEWWKVWVWAISRRPVSRDLCRVNVAFMQF